MLLTPSQTISAANPISPAIATGTDTAPAAAVGSGAYVGTYVPVPFTLGIPVGYPVPVG